MFRYPHRFAAGCVALLLLMGTASAVAEIQITPFSSGNLNYPISITMPNDGSGRFFVPEQGGAVRIMDSDGVVIGTYLTVPVSAPSPDAGEQGLLGMAFDPNFGIDPGQPGYGDFYFAFTAPGSDPRLGSAPDQVVRRFTVTDPSSNDATGATAVDVIRIPDLYSNHNGGDIHFGPDGYLYYGMGDGGSGGDPNDFAQDTGRKTVGGHSYYLLGKMLRLDVHTPTVSAGSDMCAATPGQPAEYSIPVDNPFAGSATECGEIWMYGLRNPFRWSFDRSNGDLWIGDVGQNAWEEIDLRPAGSSDGHNYGWNICEGNHYYTSGSGSDCPATTGTVAPVLEYSHSFGCATTGGYRYRGPIAKLVGTYVYSDSCSSNVWFATFNGTNWTSTIFDTLDDGYGTIVSFGEDDAGNLYLVHESEGIIYKFTTDGVTYTVTPIAGPNGSIDPDTPQVVDEGDTTAFTVTPDPGYLIDTVTGCGGSLVGDTYTTAPVTADCTVEASFVLDDTIFENGFETK